MREFGFSGYLLKYRSLPITQTCQSQIFLLKVRYKRHFYKSIKKETSTSIEALEVEIIDTFGRAIEGGKNSTKTLILRQPFRRCVLGPVDFT